MSKTSTYSLAQESSCTNDSSTRCHVCNIPVPNAFIVDHMKSSLHIYNVQIMDITLERSKDFIKANNLEIKVAEETNDEFCDICSVSYSYVQKLKHKTSDQHKKLAIYDKIFPKICILLKDFANNLEVIDEIKDVLNEREKTVNNGNSNENIKVGCNSAPREIYQNKRKSVIDENTSNSDEKDQFIDKASNVRMNTQKYSKNKSKNDKIIEEKPIANKDILVQKNGETGNELSKINLNQNTVNGKKSNMIHCDICDVHISIKEFFSHSHGRNHRKKSKALNIPEQFPRLKIGTMQTYCDVCDVYKCTESHFNSSKHKKKLYKKVLTKNHCDTYIIDTLNDSGKYCKVCKVVLEANKTMEHVESIDHLDKYKKILKSCNITKVANDYFCPTCDVFEHDIVKHVIENHKTPFLFPYETFCDVCRIKILKRNIPLHNIGKVHVDNIKAKEERHFKYIDVCVEDIGSIKEIITVDDFGLKCKICDISFYEAPPLMKHIKGDVHNNCLKNFYINNGIETLSDNEYGCNYCQRIITKLNIYEHINVEEHKERMYDELVSNRQPTNADIGKKT